MAGRVATHHLAIALLLGAALVAAGCEKQSGYPAVEVTTPKLSEKGPLLTIGQWREQVGEVCEGASDAVVATSTRLAEDLNADPEVRDEAEISRRAYSMSKPVLQDQLEELARLRPPTHLRAPYQQFIANLAAELRWTGRIAHLIGTEGAEEALNEADSSLAASASAAISFVRAHSIEGCLLGASQGQ